MASSTADDIGTSQTLHLHRDATSISTTTIRLLLMTRRRARGVPSSLDCRPTPTTTLDSFFAYVNMHPIGYKKRNHSVEADVNVFRFWLRADGCYERYRFAHDFLHVVRAINLDVHDALTRVWVDDALTRVWVDVTRPTSTNSLFENDNDELVIPER